MRKLAFILVVFILVVACKNDKPQETAKTDETVMNLQDFNTQAGEWVGKEIQVVGIVDHVCKHGGKRLFLVDDNADVHVDSDIRFDEAMVGDSIIVKGIVKEMRYDEAYCLKEEQNYMQKHKEGVDPDSVYNKKMAFIQKLRDSMKTQGVDHFSDYSIEYVSHVVK